MFSLNIQAQHTERFLELTKSLKAIDSSTVIRKYKNGNPKEITKYLKYEFGDYTYEFISGKHQLFSKEGTMFFEQEFDKFGNILTHRQINDKGEVYKFIKTEKIDSKSKTTEDFLDSDKNIIITVYEKECSSTDKNGELFLWKEGKRVNGKKIGIWKTYNGCDDSIKLKDYTKK
jgi:hypothetical protein